jgi:hypothetical protein
MKIRKHYVMIVNPLLNTVIYKRKSNYNDTCHDSIVDVWDCNFSELKDNLKIMNNKGFHILKGN